MSFLRRVLARAQGARGLQPPRVHVFARAVENGAAPQAEVGGVPQPSPTPATTSSPRVTPVPGGTRDAVAGQRSTPSVHEAPPAASSTSHTHTVERIERLVPQPARAATTVVHVHRPVVERTHERTVEVERHHIHEGEPRREEHHTERVEHHERVVVQTTTPRAAPSERVRAAPSGSSGSAADAASPVAAPRTVHVNIGRIVVSAASPAAKQRPPAIAAESARPSAKSLAEILAAKLAAKKGRS